MTQVSTRSLLVIRDETAQIALPEVIADLSVRTVDWRDIGGRSSLRDDAVFIDVDLHDVSKLRIIKSKLPYRLGKQCKSLRSIRAATSRGCKPTASVRLVSLSGHWIFTH